MGSKREHLIGPNKTISTIEDQKGHDNLRKIIEDKKGVQPYLGLGNKTYNLHRGTLVPQGYEDQYGVLMISSPQNMNITPYSEIKSMAPEAISMMTAKLKSCVSGGPILIQNGKILVTSEDMAQEKYMYPKDGICGPGQLLHGNTPNPRSVIGFNQKQVKLMDVVGINYGVGYKIENVKGLRFSELARLSHRLGMDEALNLDGGGSCFIAYGSEDPIIDLQGKRELSNYIRVDLI